MNCKGLNRQCVLASMHRGPCQKLVTSAVTNEVTPVTNAVTNRLKADVAVEVAQVFVRSAERASLRDAKTEPHPADAASRSPEAGRVGKWRDANRDHYNKAQRDLMRLRRAGRKPLGIAYG